MRYILRAALDKTPLNLLAMVTHYCILSTGPAKGENVQQVGQTVGEGCVEGAKWRGGGSCPLFMDKVKACILAQPGRCHQIAE